MFALCFSGLMKFVFGVNLACALAIILCLTISFSLQVSGNKMSQTTLWFSLTIIIYLLAIICRFSQNFHWMALAASTHPLSLCWLHCALQESGWTGSNFLGQCNTLCHALPQSHVFRSTTANTWCYKNVWTWNITSNLWHLCESVSASSNQCECKRGQYKQLVSAHGCKIN